MDPLPWYRIAATPAVLVLLTAFSIWRPSVRLRAALLGATVMSAFSVLMDQVSTRLCLEYFTVLHNPIPGLTDPTLLGVVWGVLGGAGGGLALGYAAGIAATVGKQPPMAVRDLIRPMLVAVACVAGTVTLTGAIVWFNASGLKVQLDPELGPPIPPERQIAALTVACYHMMAYGSAVPVSVCLCIWIRRERGRR